MGESDLMLPESKGNTTTPPVSSIRKFDSSTLGLRVRVPRVSPPSHPGIGNPVVFDGRVEVVLHRGYDPDGFGRDRGRVEKLDGEMTKNIHAELEIEFVGSELVDW